MIVVCSQIKGKNLLALSLLLSSTTCSKTCKVVFYITLPCLFSDHEAGFYLYSIMYTPNSAYNEKKYAKILLHYRQLVIKGNIFIGVCGIFGADIFLHYSQFSLKVTSL